jgi:uncharacterized membrane protein YoaK (UPF0700 family)
VQGERERGELALAITLTMIAGGVDAIGFLQLGHLFVSFMSGNSTQLAVSAGRGDWHESQIAGAIIASFVIGVMLGRILSRYAGRWCRPVVLAVEALLLTAAAVAFLASPIGAGLMAVAMGLQNAVIHNVAGTKTRVTFVTGTLVNFGEKLTDALLRTDPALAFLPELCQWLGFVAGAAAGTLLYGQLKIGALAIPAASLAALSATTACLVWREPR